MECRYGRLPFGIVVFGIVLEQYILYGWYCKTTRRIEKSIDINTQLILNNHFSDL